MTETTATKYPRAALNPRAAVDRGFIEHKIGKTVKHWVRSTGKSERKIRGTLGVLPIDR